MGKGTNTLEVAQILYVIHKTSDIALLEDLDQYLNTVILLFFNHN